MECHPPRYGHPMRFAFASFQDAEAALRCYKALNVQVRWCWTASAYYGGGGLLRPRAARPEKCRLPNSICLLT